MAKLPGKRKGKKNSFSIEECRCTGRIVESELLPSKKNKKNKAIVLHFKMKNGDSKGKIVKQWFSIKHTNPETEKIAFEQLDNIAFCCGIGNYKDTKQFHGIDLTLDVTKSKDGKYNQVEVFPLEKKGKKGKKKPF